MGETVRLGDLVELTRGTTYKSALLDQPGPVLLGLGSIARDGGFRTDALRTYGGDSPARLTLGPGDLYVSLKDVTQSGDLLGSVARVPEYIESGRLTQDTLRVVVRDDRVDATYLYWTLRTPGYREYCRAHAIGTTNLSLSRDDFLNFELPLPSPSRLRLVETLGALDDKIELNRRLCVTIQATLRSAFDHLMAEEAASGVPWRSVPIGELAAIVGGSTPSTANPDYWIGGTNCWATPKDLSRLRSPVLLDTERRITDRGLAQISSGLLPAGTVLMSSRAPIGYLAIPQVPVAVNQGFIALKPLAGISSLFLLAWLGASQELIKAQANGSTFLEISKAAFRPIELSVPPAELMETFDRTVRPLWDQLVVVERQTVTLREIRDSLLPRLLSGELEVAA